MRRNNDCAPPTRSRRTNETDQGVVSRNPADDFTDAEEFMKQNQHTSARDLGRNVTAFTLVELLVVIGIIALLISILLPTLASVRQSASAIKCRSNLKQIGTAAYMYAQAFDGSLPYGLVDRNDVIPGNPVPWQDEGNDWTTLLFRFMTTNAGTGDETQEKVTVASANARGTFLCPDVARDNTSADFITHFSAHPRLMPDLKGEDWAMGTPVRGLKPYMLAGIKRPSEVVLAVDATVTNPAWGANATLWALDANAINRRPYLLDNWTNSFQPIGPNDPVNLRPWNTADPAVYNTDQGGNSHNIRFRQDRKSVV